MKKCEEISCEKCENYCRIVDRHGKSRGYICCEWASSMAGDASWFYPTEMCFTKRTRRTKRHKTFVDVLIELAKETKPK